MITALRCKSTGVDNRQAGKEPELKPVVITIVPESLLPSPGIATYVSRHTNRFGADFMGQPHRLGHRVATAYHQVTAAVDQRVAEVSQALMEEPVTVA